MNRWLVLFSDCQTTVPRASGDEPYSGTGGGLVGACSPRQRG